MLCNAVGELEGQAWTLEGDGALGKRSGRGVKTLDETLVKAAVRYKFEDCQDRCQWISAMLELLCGV